MQFVLTQNQESVYLNQDRYFCISFRFHTLYNITQCRRAVQCDNLAVNGKQVIIVFRRLISRQIELGVLEKTRGVLPFFTFLFPLLPYPIPSPPPRPISFIFYTLPLPLPSLFPPSLFLLTGFRGMIPGIYRCSFVRFSAF
jgi:hypothetical protein